ncbi:DgyrCDS14927 [Dimorphilus gyrociliatus]|uniref:DgyrCDS14927 n=1 Tax=Dimorphilus gyrociliatus TaxID=2664684 RepID=A0A7I8WFN2_9ANNE|nr:DgyrCDS14927 [Dimorphilus gyrociliatus]
MRIFFQFIIIFGFLTGKIESMLNMYLNTIEVALKVYRDSSSTANNFHIRNTMDGSSLEWKSDFNTPNKYLETLNFTMRGEFSIVKIRFLQTRLNREKISVTFLMKDNSNNKSFVYEVNRGWNEFHLEDAITPQKIILRLNESDYDEFSVGEFQAFTRVQTYSSCLEMSKHNPLDSSTLTFIHETINLTMHNVASTELGAVCQSSSGKCLSAIQDRINIFDEMWLASDNNNEIKPFIKITFFKRYLIEEIRINQPLSNTIPTIDILNEQSRFVMIINSISQWSHQSLSIYTKWLNFQFDRSKGTFEGVFEIEAMSRTPRVAAAVFCAKDEDDNKAFRTVNENILQQFTRAIKSDSNSYCSGYLDYYKGFNENGLEATKINADYCFQAITVYCKGVAVTDQFYFDLYGMNGHRIRFFNSTSQCFTNESLSCMCTNNINNDTIIHGYVNLSTKNLPIVKACLTKRQNDPVTITLSLKRFICYSYDNSITSDNQIIVDNDLETCYPIRVNRFDEIAIRKSYNSSLKVQLWIRDENRYPSCETIDLWKHSKGHTCNNNENNYQKCHLSNEYLSHQTYGKTCEFQCQQSVIDTLLIIYKMTNYANLLQICEITITQLDSFLI